jgi:septum formation topological specificity factor MinE
MMTRRDLAEKFLRLKILESQSRFLKALSEMIQEELHTELYKIIAKYAPTLEGLKEYLKSY